MDYPARYWSWSPDGRMQCDLCPRSCQLHEGQRGLCFVRRRSGEKMVLTTFGRSSGFCVDPIEKKPLNHFFPGTGVLSFGTAGCNLSCRFCQNWDISKSRATETLSASASPRSIALRARELDIPSVAFTYNDPVIFLEYACEVSRACQEEGIAPVAVTAGYMSADARPEFFSCIKAANVDLKSMDEDFYHRLCAGGLEPVLDTLKYLCHAGIWLEITNLLIPGQNSEDSLLEKMCSWIKSELGVHVPLHFTAFHPDYKMLGVAATPPALLRRARRIALMQGLQFVYTGNVHDPEGQTTYCPDCSLPVIERDWYRILAYRLDEKGSCKNCKRPLEGIFQKNQVERAPLRQPVFFKKEQSAGLF